MKFRILIVLLFPFVLSIKAQNEKTFNDLDSTNYKEILLTTKNVDQQLQQRFKGSDFTELVALIGVKYDTLAEGKSKFIHDQKPFKNDKELAMIYSLGMIHYDSTSSNTYALIVVVKNNKIKDVYTSYIHISWAR